MSVINPLWHKKESDTLYGRIGFTEPFLEVVHSSYHVLPTHKVGAIVNEKQPLFVLETSDELVTVVAPFKLRSMKFSHKALDYPDLLTPDDTVLDWAPPELDTKVPVEPPPAPTELRGLPPGLAQLIGDANEVDTNPLDDGRRLFVIRMATAGGTLQEFHHILNDRREWQEWFRIVREYWEQNFMRAIPRNDTGRAATIISGRVVISVNAPNHWYMHIPYLIHLIQNGCRFVGVAQQHRPWGLPADAAGAHDPYMNGVYKVHELLFYANTIMRHHNPAAKAMMIGEIPKWGEIGQ